MYGTSTHSHSVDASMLCQPLWREGRRDAAQRVRPLLRRQGLLRNRCATAEAALDSGASAAIVGQLWAGQGLPPAVRGVPPPTMVDVPVRLLGLGALRRG